VRIEDIGRYASVGMLSRARFGRLACAFEGQPYVTPISFAYDGECLYSFSTVGQKIRWMRANPLVCLEIEELTSAQEWATVVVSGKYEELPPCPENREYRERAYELLRRRPVWWEPGYVKTLVNETVRPLEGIYFRICVDKISGRRGIPDSVPERVCTPAGSHPFNWFRRMLGPMYKRSRSPEALTGECPERRQRVSSENQNRVHRDTHRSLG